MPAGLHFYSGDLHGHTSYSDGEGTPEQAYAAAQSRGLDFFSLSEHSEWFDVPGEAVGCASAVDPLGCAAASPLPLSKWDREAQTAAAATVPGSFVALRGFEQTMDIQGHMNVFTSAGYTTRTASPDPVMAAFWNWFTNPLPNVVTPGGLSTSGLDGLGQFNHPARDSNPLPGEDLRRWDNFAYVAAADDRMVSIEVMNKGGDHSQYYPVALDHGWHLAPVAVSDNHDLQFGQPRFGRTLIVAPELSAESVRTALLARHVAATFDSGLRLVLYSGVHMMGDRWGEPVNASVPVTVKFSGAGSPATLVEIISNGGIVVASGSPQSGEWSGSVSYGGGGEKYYYARLVEANGAKAFTAPLWISQA